MFGNLLGAWNLATINGTNLLVTKKQPPLFPLIPFFHCGQLLITQWLRQKSSFSLSHLWWLSLAGFLASFSGSPLWPSGMEWYKWKPGQDSDWQENLWIFQTFKRRQTDNAGGCLNIFYVCFGFSPLKLLQGWCRTL